MCINPKVIVNVYDMVKSVKIVHHSGLIVIWSDQLVNKLVSLHIVCILVTLKISMCYILYTTANYISSTGKSVTRFTPTCHLVGQMYVDTWPSHTCFLQYCMISTWKWGKLSASQMIKGPEVRTLCKPLKTFYTNLVNPCLYGLFFVFTGTVMIEHVQITIKICWTITWFQICVTIICESLFLEYGFCQSFHKDRSAWTWAGIIKY